MPIFTVTREHLDLMKALRFYFEDDSEYGGPSVDCKRPFGNSGRHQIVLDMAQALGIPMEKVFDSAKDELIEPEAERIEALYRELPRAMECCFRCGSLEPGTYEAPAYTSKWKRIEAATRPAASAEQDPK